MSETALTIKDKNELRKELPEQLSPAQLVFMSQRTPPAFIKSRVGRGGTFNYVEIGYIIKMLNSIFGFGGWDWEYSLTEPLSFPNSKQIVVRGRLTVKIFKDERLITTITKTASGGKDIAYPKGGGDPIDLGDDEKSASADALKKAASLLGIAEDVYAPSIYKAQEAVNRSRSSTNPKDTMSAEDVTKDVEVAMEQEDPSERTALQRAIFTVAKDLSFKGKLKLIGLTDIEKKQAIKTFLGEYAIKIESFSKDPIENLRFALSKMQELSV